MRKITHTHKRYWTKQSFERERKGTNGRGQMKNFVITPGNEKIKRLYGIKELYGTRKNTAYKI